MSELAETWHSFAHANVAIAEGRALAHLNEALAAIPVGMSRFEVSSERDAEDPALHVILYTEPGTAEALRDAVNPIIVRLNLRYSVLLDVLVAEP